VSTAATVPRIVEVRRNILKRNDEIARALRTRFQEAGVFVVSLVSSPGSGKTAFLERTLSLLKRTHRTAALVGDLATDNDAMRLARSGSPVRQITTGTMCHLEAAMVEQSLGDWVLSQLDFLFVENVGNLVCPSSFDLGENLRLVLLSVTEGEDKPLKYPTIFHSADLAIITKADLAEAVEFDRDLAERNIHKVAPDMPILYLSSKTGMGMDEWVERIALKRSPQRPGPGTVPQST
jgi:hydrogenase nickel incorporation protein HypB